MTSKRFRWFLLVIIICACTSVRDQSTDVSTRPNVILIITDDQGYGDLGFHGNPHIETPRLDGLAGNSVRFSRFFVSPVCAPTRASLMTGRQSLRTGIHDTYNGGAIMAANEVTIAEMLADAGYITGMFGKWHLGDNYPSRPHDQGFQETLHHLGGGIGQPGDWPNYPKKDSSYFDPILWEKSKQVRTSGYCSDVFTDATVSFIESNKDNPFFAYLAFNAPHDPLQLPQEYYDMYKEIDPSLGFEDDDRPFPSMDERNKEIARKVYGMVTNIDDNVGKVLDKLEELNLNENTLVIFMTDNGPWGNRYRAGMRGNKGSVFQGGIAVPSFWRLPSRFEGDREIDVNATHMDVMPTLAALCGASLPTDRIIDGENLLPLIEGAVPEWSDRDINFYWNRRYPVRYQNMTLIRGNYKLVGVNRELDPVTGFELFNLADDPFEQNDLSAQYPDMVSDLKSNMDKWYREIVTSPNLVDQPGAVVNPVYENPVILNRNDAGGDEGIWTRSEGVYGYWEVAFEEGGYYDFVFKFNESMNGGLMKLQVGAVLHAINTSERDFMEFKMENVYIPPGKARLIPQLITGDWPDWKRFFPFLVEIHKK